MTRKPLFQDEIFLQCQGGQGGHGLISFDLTTAHKTKGKPNGGMGGMGGNVYMLGKAQLDDLNHLTARKYLGGKGKDGGKNCRAGARGEDVFIAVPVNTSAVIYPNNLILGQVRHDGDVVMLAQGGKAGVGNGIIHSAKIYGRHIGGSGECLELKLTYLLESDFAIVGPSNAGKSSLFNYLIQHDKSQVADYLFTTQKPILGVNSTSLVKRVTFLDTPAFDFCDSNIYLRYLKNTHCLLYAYDSTDNDGSAKLQHFLHLVGPAGLQLAIVITKTDLVTPGQLKALQLKLLKITHLSPQRLYPVSVINQEGLSPLLAWVVPTF